MAKRLVEPKPKRRGLFTISTLCFFKNYSIMRNLDAVCAPLPFDDFWVMIISFEENILLSRTIEKKTLIS